MGRKICKDLAYLLREVGGITGVESRICARGGGYTYRLRLVVDGRSYYRSLDLDDAAPFESIIEHVRREKALLVEQVSGTKDDVCSFLCQYRSEHGLSEGTMLVYKTALDGFSVSDRSRNLSLVNTRLLSADISQNVKHQRLGIIRRVFSWLCQKGYAKHNPADGVSVRCEPSTPRTRTFTRDEIARLLESVRRTARLHDELLLLLAMTTGARVSTLGALKAGDLDASNHLHMYNVKQKRPYKYSQPVTNARILHLFRILSEGLSPNECVFGSERDQINLFRRLDSRIARMFPRTTAGSLSLHSIRHTVATNAIRNGVPFDQVSRLLDHDSVSTTLKVYAKHSQEQIDGAAQMAALV